MRTVSACFSALVPSVITATVGLLAATHAWAEPPTHATWEMTFRDEFDGDAVDWDVWESQAGPRGRTKPEGRWPENNLVEEGVLYQVTKKESPPRGDRVWSTAHIMTRTFRQQYGYFEAKLRYGKYLNNAFWLFRPPGKRFPEPPHFEIDVNEGHTPRELAMTLHFFVQPEGTDEEERYSTGKRWDAPMDLDEDFHIYAVEWNEKELIWYFDGTPVRRLANPNCHAPADVRLSTVIMTRQLERDKVDIETMQGVSMAVDWVRVYRKKEDLDRPKPPQLPELEVYRTPKLVRRDRQVAPAKQKTELLTEDFQTVALGGLPEKWELGDGAPEVIASHIGSAAASPAKGNQILRLKAQDYALVMFDQPVKGRLEVEFDYYTAEKRESLLLVTLGDFDRANPARRRTSYYSGNIGPYIHWRGPHINYFTKQEQWTRFALWKRGQWNHARFVVDVAGRVFDYYTGEGGTQFESGGLFRGSQGEAKGLGLRHRGAGYPVYVDNLVVRALND